MTDVRSARRYFLLKSQYHLEFCDPSDRGLADAFLRKHDALSGTPLPATVPFQTALAAAHYTTVEDLFGADVGELMEWASLTYPQAQAVLFQINPRCAPADPSSKPTLVANATGQTA